MSYQAVAGAQRAPTDQQLALLKVLAKADRPGDPSEGWRFTKTLASTVVEYPLMWGTETVREVLGDRARHVLARMEKRGWVKSYMEPSRSGREWHITLWGARELDL